MLGIAFPDAEKIAERLATRAPACRPFGGRMG